MAGGLGEPHVPGDDGGVHLAREVALDLLGHLHGQVGASIVHGEDHALQINALVEGPLDDADGGEEVAQALQGVILALDRDHDGVGGAQGVEGKQLQRGGAVDEDIIVLLPEGLQSVFQQVLPVVNADHLHGGAGQSLVGGDHVGPLGGDDGLPAVGAVDEDVVDGGGCGGLVHSKAGGGVGLGVEVADEDPLAQLLQGGGQVDTGGGLTHTALLVDNGNGFSHGTPRFLVPSGIVCPQPNHGIMAANRNTYLHDSRVSIPYYNAL